MFDAFKKQVKVEIFILGGFLLVVAAVRSIVPAIETRFFPVMRNDARIVGPPRQVDGGVLVSAEATKVRDCDWVQTQFFYGARGERDVPMPRAEHRDNPKIRGPGTLHWGNIFLPVDPQEVQNTHWDTVHDCFGGFWKVRSKLFDGTAPRD